MVTAIKQHLLSIYVYMDTPTYADLFLASLNRNGTSKSNKMLGVSFLLQIKLTYTFKGNELENWTS